VRRRACGRKRKYAEEADARRAAHLVSLKTGEEFSAYKCSFCGPFWHVGHTPASIKRISADKKAGRKD
jgi:hypothetical protein